MKDVSRREFMEKGALSAAGLLLTSLSGEGGEMPLDRDIRIGVVGVGGRGTHLLRLLLGMPGVSVPAVCDIQEPHRRRAQDLVEEQGQPRPEGYGKDEHHYQAFMEREDLDAVLIATYWQWHTPMAVCAMKNGKVPGVEVPAALTVEECWQLVDTSEAYKIPCMMLENWSFRRDNLAVLNMIRKGLMGEIVHSHCAHSHDCIDHWFFDRQGNDRWPAQFLIKRNCDQYPTHSLGPVISWLDINCGDAYASLTSTATDSKAINAYFERTFGSDHPGAKRSYKQGDIVTTVIRTHGGKSIVVNYDMQLPRPYDNRWLVQGTLGLYNEQRNAVYLMGKSPQYHEWEPFAAYQETYDHSWWQTLLKAGGGEGHGGTDSLEIRLFVESVRLGVTPPIDVYDSVAMSCIVGLSEMSIAQGSAPVECPDFTRGKWKTREPSFGI